MKPEPSMSVSVGMRGTNDSRAGQRGQPESRFPPRRPRRSAELEAQLLGADEVLVAVRDAAPRHALAPGTASLVLVDAAGARTTWSVRVRP